MLRQESYAVERFPFATTRWIESRYRKRMTNTAALSKDKVRQLREMFDHIDEDNSGEIEVEEIAKAMKYLSMQSPDKIPFDFDQVLEAFQQFDTDGSGTLDFEEFLEIMTSDIRGKGYASLQDERKADEERHNIFFEFATLYRRNMLREKIQNLDGEISGYSAFSEMFELQFVVDKLTQEAEKRCFSDHRRAVRRQRKKFTDRANLAARHLAVNNQHTSSTFPQKYKNRPVTATGNISSSSCSANHHSYPRAHSKKESESPFYDYSSEPYAWLSSVQKSNFQAAKTNDLEASRYRRLQSITVPLNATHIRQQCSQRWLERRIPDERNLNQFPRRCLSARPTTH